MEEKLGTTGRRDGGQCDGKLGKTGRRDGGQCDGRETWYNWKEKWWTVRWKRNMVQ